MKEKVEYNLQANVNDIYTGFINAYPIGKNMRTPTDERGFKPMFQSYKRNLIDLYYNNNFILNEMGNRGLR